MEMKEINDKISALYDDTIAHSKMLVEEYEKTAKEILEADHAGGKNITYDRYQYLCAKRQALKIEIDLHNEYFRGIVAVANIVLKS